MKRSALFGATAVIALVAGLGAANPARAQGAEEETEPLIVELPAEDGGESAPSAPAMAVEQPAPAAAMPIASEPPNPEMAEPPAPEVAAEQRAPGMAEQSTSEMAVEQPAPERDQAPAPRMAEAEPEPQPQPVPEPVAAAQAEPAPQPAPAPAVAQAQEQQQSSASAEVPPQPEMPGVLTRKGALVIEPGIEYAHTDVNQFAFAGVELLSTVLIGSIEAKQANRDAITGTLGLRLGITNRMEGELRIPYMYRDDTSTNTIIATNQQQDVSLTDHGLGDIEGALHYQLNDGTGKWPVFVGNMRVKSTTGTSPYDVDRDAAGVEQELATGSGFWAVEPSLTIIAPSDPAVFYGNIGYLWNMKSSIDKQIGNRFVEEVDPGDAIRLGVGMGLALNEKVSFSIGYQHDWIMKTTTDFSDGSVDSPSLSVGAMTFGVNWQMADNAALNVSVGIGVTEDAPDVRLMARVPITLDLF